jgi:hypothetical protein
MTTQLHNTGEEFILDKLDGASFPVSVFRDATDTLADADDLNAISTEPAGGSFSRQPASVSVAQTADGDGLLEVNDVTFDVSDSTQTVDAGFVVVNFASTQAGSGDHLLFSFPLTDPDGTQQTVDLSKFESFTITGQSLSLD